MKTITTIAALALLAANATASAQSNKIRFVAADIGGKLTVSTLESAK